MIKTLKQQVEHCLDLFPETRNSDIELTIRVWKTFYSEMLMHTIENNDSVMLKELFNLPREDNIKRIRAKIQNDEKRLLPTEWKIAKKRGIFEDEWRVAMGYPPKNRIGQDKLFDIKSQFN